MSSISVEVNGRGIATISLAGMDVVNVSVHGALDSEQKALLSAMGGDYSEGGCGHLIWIAEHGLLPGEVVSVRLIEECCTATQGKTIAELTLMKSPCPSLTSLLTSEWRRSCALVHDCTKGFLFRPKLRQANERKQRATILTLTLRSAFYGTDSSRIRYACGWRHTVSTMSSPEPVVLNI